MFVGILFVASALEDPGLEQLLVEGEVVDGRAQGGDLADDPVVEAVERRLGVRVERCLAELFEEHGVAALVSEAHLDG